MIAKLETLLKSLIGLDASTLGRGAIERAMRQRLKACAMDEEAYWTHIRQSPAEQHALIEAIVVPETWFFRYPESFALLATQARQLQSRRPAGQPLRLLSLPCSTGEEPYSIAIALLDALLSPEAFQIDALDVSLRAIEMASQGRYGANAFRGDDPAIRERYFQREADGSHRIHKHIAAMVNFQRGNILDSIVPPNLMDYDIIFCRNLLIYFDRPTQLRALTNLKRWLRADGLLFAGPAEAGMLNQQGFESLDSAHSFAFRRSHTPAIPAAPRLVTPLPTKPMASAPRSLAPQSAIATRHVAPAPAMQSDPRPRPDAAAGMSQIIALANAGREAEALNACVAQLANHGPSADLHFWWGLVCDGAGQTDAALRQYRKSLYLEPYHARALAHLAALLGMQGDHSGAARLQQRLKQRETQDAGKS